MLASAFYHVGKGGVSHPNKAILERVRLRQSIEIATYYCMPTEFPLEALERL